MRRIWSMFGESKAPPTQAKPEEESDGNEENIEMTSRPTAATPVILSRECLDEPSINTVEDKRSLDKSKGKQKKKKRSTEESKEKKKFKGSREFFTRSIVRKKKEEKSKDKDDSWSEKRRNAESNGATTPVKKIEEAREINKADDEEFENDSGGENLAKAKIKTRDLKWKSEDAPPVKVRTRGSVDASKDRLKKSSKSKIAEAKEVNKADDEEFENEGAAPMAKSKIKTRDLNWKSSPSTPEAMSEVSPGKVSTSCDSESSEDYKKNKKSKKYGKVKNKIDEAREINKADDEEFENDGGKENFAKSKIKTRDLKWKKEEPEKPEIVEAREVNKADDEEFENESGGQNMARSKIKTRDLKWKKEDSDPPENTPPTRASEERRPRIVEAREVNKADDEEFENDSGSAGEMARTKIKTRELKWRDEKSSSSLPSQLSPTSPPAIQEEKKEERKKESTVTTLVRKKPSTSAGSKKKEDSRDEKSIVRPRSRPTQSKDKSKETNDKSYMRTKRSSIGKGQRESYTEPEATSKDTSPRRGAREDKSSKSSKSSKKMHTKQDEIKYSLEELLPKIESNQKDVQTCRRLMEMLKRNNLLENALFPSQNETVRAHFSSGSRRIDKKTMDLLFKATDFVLDKIMYRGEDLDEYIDNNLKAFILARNKSRTMVVEHLLKHPEFLPQSWGGRTVVLINHDEEVNVTLDDDKIRPDKK